MRIKLLRSKKELLTSLILIVCFFAHSQEDPFNCDYNAYLFQYNDIYALDLASGNSYLVKENVTPGNVNAVGYNPADGYIWGSLSTPSKSIVKIGKNFSTEVVYIPELPTSNRYVGDVREDGVYYLKPGGSTYYLVDLNPNSNTYKQFITSKTLSSNLNIHDWAFNAVDGMLYTVEKATNILYRIDPETGVVTALGVVPILNGVNYTFGAVYFDVEGRFYVSANQTGTVYVIQDVQNLELGSLIQSNLFAFGPSSSLNDGARCPTAPVPQEDCINGIDDDGDGLTDCDDPSCSGVAACPVISPTVSTGNEGGLESNDRLSSLINRRNYLRAKQNYKFDKALAKKITKSDFYNKTASKSGLSLRDLIPLDILPNTDAIESSPTDLINMTNASELFSVDYVKDDKTVAVILATKTENGVYEHTKYICDRLLGAELLNVSTIEIKEHTFIKSIIKNVDGSKEFVLSFSGKVVNDKFEIESHWNIDKYEQGATYYNFQIWTNQIDDLVKLGEEALNLFNTQKEITKYDNSTPPTVFVKKGKYVNGTLELEVVNKNKTETITYTSGYKRTETASTEYANKDINLDGSYITSMIVNTGNVFDIGFRLENGTDTPDDLFMSDGPWGSDDSSTGTTVNTFEITQNDDVYTGLGYRVERNINLEAETSTYVAAYRAFTPRFTPVDLASYSALEFNAAGTGEVEITILKKSIDAWEDQFRATITLDDNEKHFAIPFDHFKSNSISDMDLYDATSIVFTMSSDGTTVVTKTLNLSDIEFTQKSLSIDDNVVAENESLIYPNPMSSQSDIIFYAEASVEANVEIYNITGALVSKTTIRTEIGNNKVTLYKKNLKRGLYFVKINSKYRTYKSNKLIVN